LSEPVTPKRPHYLWCFHRSFEVLHSDTDVENVSESLPVCFLYPPRTALWLSGSPFASLHDHDAPIVRCPARAKNGSAHGSRSLLS
jgi:hypothetical protein